MKKELNYKEFLDCSIIAKNIFIVRTNHATVDVAAMILISLFHDSMWPQGTALRRSRNGRSARSS